MPFQPYDITAYLPRLLPPPLPAPACSIYKVFGLKGDIHHMSGIPEAEAAKVRASARSSARARARARGSLHLTRI